MEEINLIPMQMVDSTRKILLQKGVARYLGQNKLNMNHFINHIVMKILRTT